VICGCPPLRTLKAVAWTCRRRSSCSAFPDLLRFARASSCAASTLAGIRRRHSKKTSHALHASCSAPFKSTGARYRAHTADFRTSINALQRTCTQWVFTTGCWVQGRHAPDTSSVGVQASGAPPAERRAPSQQLIQARQSSPPHRLHCQRSQTSGFTGTHGDIMSVAAPPGPEYDTRACMSIPPGRAGKYQRLLLGVPICSAATQELPARVLCPLGLG